MPDDIWLVFMLKDKYSSSERKQQLKNSILKKYNLKCNQIVYISYEQNSALSYYFFVKQYNKTDLDDIYNSFFQNFQSYNSCMRITDNQLNNLLKNIKKQNYDNVKFGDFVIIKTGCYKKLFGVVLRENKLGKLQVGLKFGFGNIIKSYKASQLKSIDNIFNHIKVLK